MADRALLDTGFVVALVNADDPDHAACVAVWSECRAELYTVEGVLVEAAHLLRGARGGAKAAAELLIEAEVQISPATPATIARAVALMDKYRDVPMDFVDARLVALAEETGIRDVLTLDRRGFGAYRARGRERFRVAP